MKYVILASLLLHTLSLSAQTEKGATPLATQNSKLKTQNSTRAVVVGISDYQAADIPDLQYADEDAKAFANWLHSPAGGDVPEENIILLTNGEATQARLVAALDGLMEDCHEGDQAIIYFSGHGDVEKKTLSQPGYLLCYNSPPQTYMAGGAFNLRDLQDIISTLSVQNKARLVVITDACHAGKLAGATIGGTLATAQALSRQFANEVKIMSCQPNEFSLEGTQWGGGRGVFSYHLLEGLTGLSDKNSDGVVSLFEITRYLQDIVPAETAPHSQIPMTVGELQTPLSRVDAEALAALHNVKAGKQPQMDQIVGKGLVGNTDSFARVQYTAFETALREKILLEPSGLCANDLYLQLIQNDQLKPLHSLMRRNLAAALQDEVQQALNALLDNDPYEANSWTFNPAKYTEYPRYLQRSMELLGESHYMYRTLLAKKHYFEGYNLAKNLGDLENDPARRDSFKLAAKAKFLEAIRLEPEAAYPYYAIGDLYYYQNPLQTDSLVWWCAKASELSPNWLAPYLLISYEYGGALIQLEPAEVWLRKALARHPKSYLALERLSWLKQWQGKADESMAISKEMIALKPDIFNAYSTLAVTLTQMKGEYLESEKYCLKSLGINPNQGWWAQAILLKNYLRTRRAALVVETGINCLKNNQTYNFSDKGDIVSIVLSGLVQLGRYEEATYWTNVATAGQWGSPAAKTYIAMESGRAYLLRGNTEKAESVLLHALTIDVSLNDSWPAIFALLGDINALNNRLAEAEKYYIQGVTNSGFLGCLFCDEAKFRYGRFLLAQNRGNEAEAQFRKIADILPKSYYHGYGMALLAAARKNNTEALDWLEKSLDNFWPDETAVQAEPLFAKLRKTKRFRDLLAKHFPETSK